MSASTSLEAASSKVVQPLVANAGEGVDYASAYAAYWSRADRWGSRSFADAGMLAHQVLVTCGGGKVLDVGCGMGDLVRALLARGVDACGVDVAPAPVEHANRLCPGRFAEGSILALPYRDGSFDTVTCTDCLEHLAEGDVEHAIRELVRVVREGGAIFLTIATRPDRDGKWHLTVRGRAWWEERLLAAGLRKHPCAMQVTSYEALEDEGASFTAVLEKIPAEAAKAWPVESLRAGRTLHMDMLREGGRRSDAHVARYVLAAGVVRRGDTVLDAACGLGYGSAVLARMSGLARVIGIDNDAGAVAYARANYGGQAGGGRCEFREGDCQSLAGIEDSSVDVVVSMETLEHLADPGAFLRETARVLRPGGRLVASVPNDWTDETGKDPNPHHLHVYTWERLAEQLRDAGFTIERRVAQTAGGGMKHGDQPRRLRTVDLDAAEGEAGPAEWWLVVAMKPAHGPASKREEYAAFARAHGEDDRFNPLAFARDYDNPWLAPAMVTIGHRATEPKVLEELAARTLKDAREDSADRGAALCVLAYRVLEGAPFTGPGTASRPAGEVEGLLAQIAEYDRATEGTTVPHVLRWRISLRFAAARLLMAMGRRGEARAMYERCAALDPCGFSPLLATKTVEALFYAGLIALMDGEDGAARGLWKRGLEETRRVLNGDWSQVWGTVERPAPFALGEIGALADAAGMCAQGLIGLEDWRDRPGRVWRDMHAGTKEDFRRWIAHLERTPRGESAKAAAAAPAGGEREASKELRAWNEQLTKARGWLEKQVENWKTEAERRAGVIENLKTWTDQLTAGKKWLEDQAAAARVRVAEVEARVAELERELAAADERAAVARAELLDRAATLAGQVQKQAVENMELKGRLETAQAEVHLLHKRVKDERAEIARLRTPMGVLRTVGRWFVPRKGTGADGPK